MLSRCQLDATMGKAMANQQMDMYNKDQRGMAHIAKHVLKIIDGVSARVVL